MPSATKGNDVQSAYQLTVEQGRHGSLGQREGRVSDKQSFVPYGGPALASGEAYSWSVRTWDKDGEASPAATSTFETGLTDAGLVGRALDPPPDQRQ